ncbi:Uncharacterised protein [Bordetella pertussis]|nr:Uncharacterised protein [Bordetella pertussis]
MAKRLLATRNCVARSASLSRLTPAATVRSGSRLPELPIAPDRTLTSSRPNCL